MSTFRQLPVRLDIEFRRGDSLRVPIQLQRNDGTTEEPILRPRDLRGHQFSAQVRRREKDAEVLATFDVVEEFDDPDAATPVGGFAEGRFSIRLTGEQTQVIDKDCVYDVQSIAADGFVRTWVAGKIVVQLDVTRLEPEPEPEPEP